MSEVIPGLFMFGLFMASISSIVGLIVAIIEIANKQFKNPKDKVLWIILLLLFGLPALIVYFVKRKDLLAPQEGQPRQYLPELPEREARPMERYDRDQYV